jgi:exoribonuclease-2
MLPPAAIGVFSLAEGGVHPALSLYVDVREADFAIENRHTRIELVPIVANLRHHNTERLDAAFPAGEVPADVPYAGELHLLWRLAIALEIARGKQSNQVERAKTTASTSSRGVAVSPWTSWSRN